MNVIAMILSLVLLLIAGIPAFFSIGLSTLLYFVLARGWTEIPYFIVAQRTVFGLDSFTLLAIPLFLFVGKIMNASGVTERLFGFARAGFGHVRGGLGQVNIAASVIFAGMSGSAVADAAGLGAIEIKAMTDANYPKGFACSITAVSSIIGPIIPPSVPVVLYAIMANVSVSRLLIAGVVPGLLLGLGLAGFVAYQARKYNYPVEEKASWAEYARSFRRAFLPLLTPVILVGGILSGIFTATEAAAVAGLYAIILALVVYRSLSLGALYALCRETMLDSAVIMGILAIANLFAWVLVRERVPLLVVSGITALTENYYLVMLLCVAALLVLGLFLSATVSILVATPVLVPLVTAVGGDPLHFGIIMIITLMLGVVTPPFGLVLFAISRVGDIAFAELVRGVLPYYLPILLMLLLMIVFPQLVTFLPRLLM